MDKKLFAELLEAVKEAKAIREGRAKPGKVTRYKALDPKAIRQKSGLSQERFSALMGVKLATYRNWEQGRRVPHGPAQVLLMVADFDPTIIRRAIRAQREEIVPEGIAAFEHSRAATAAPILQVECPAPAQAPAFLAAYLLGAEEVRSPGTGRQP